MRTVKSPEDCADCLCKICAKNTVNDSYNPSAPYKECGCDNCDFGNQVIETTDDCKGFALGCDDCLETDCNRQSCKMIERS